ncbi:hypothetical protein BO70DRAFT_47570 [Aspergillus heteromorphus CBS 117.55]|uniref:Uncharacterized protein n=1 Tax=Aspergillus heteromorphus CBS 117.55 TaxID=1448321 RepID=A0A317W267_9EURO|nr:uncharacterized protein BO70DRAFT_47570 [Aspergillus heteromorphus CBS 117.55]PWY80664.1 hypothetical protein BO70DRAFT_47570 [Aspergillus heteromorphus CBS 117.55]
MVSWVFCAFTTLFWSDRGCLREDRYRLSVWGGKVCTTMRSSLKPVSHRAGCYPETPPPAQEVWAKQSTGIGSTGQDRMDARIITMIIAHHDKNQQAGRQAGR